MFSCFKFCRSKHTKKFPIKIITGHTFKCGCTFFNLDAYEDKVTGKKRITLNIFECLINIFLSIK